MTACDAVMIKLTTSVQQVGQKKTGRKFETYANTCGAMLLEPLACAFASAPVAIFTFGCSSKPFPVSTDMIFSLQASNAHPP